MNSSTTLAHIRNGELQYDFSMVRTFPFFFFNTFVNWKFV